MEMTPANLTLRTLEELGYAAEEVATVDAMSTGLILTASPRHSGNTSTLFALLTRMAGRSTDVCTIEDPIEIVVPGFQQRQIQLKTGFGFVQGVCWIKEQKPRFALVGEICDTAVAHAVFDLLRAGTRVFSSLYAQDSVGGILRLLDLGLGPRTIAEGLSGVIYQRLCPRAGAAGLTAVPEILKVSDRLRKMLLEDASPEQLRAQVLAEGTVPLEQVIARRQATGLPSERRNKRD